MQIRLYQCQLKLSFRLGSTKGYTLVIKKPFSSLEEVLKYFRNCLIKCCSLEKLSSVLAEPVISIFLKIIKCS